MFNRYAVFARVAAIVLTVGLLLFAAVEAAMLGSFWIFLAVTVPIVINCVLLFGFARLAQEVSDSNELLKFLVNNTDQSMLLKKLDELRQLQNASPANKTEASAQSGESAPESDAAEKEFVRPIEIDAVNGKCTCPLCGARQNTGRKRCFDCGVWFGNP